MMEAIATSSVRSCILPPARRPGRFVARHAIGGGGNEYASGTPTRDAVRVTPTRDLAIAAAAGIGSCIADGHEFAKVAVRVGRRSYDSDTASVVWQISSRSRRIPSR